MNCPNFTKCQTELTQMKNKAGENTVLDRYDLGKKVLGVATGDRVYGGAVVPVLAEFLGCAQNLLWACRQFASAYERAEVERLLERASVTGHEITFGHFRCLSALGRNRASTRLRKQFEKKIVKEGMPIRELRQLLAHERDCR